jgi:hypothetical protein
MNVVVFRTEAVIIFIVRREGKVSSTTTYLHGEVVKSRTDGQSENHHSTTVASGG